MSSSVIRVLSKSGGLRRGLLLVGASSAKTKPSQLLIRNYAEKANEGSSSGGSGGRIFSALIGATAGAGAYYLYSSLNENSDKIGCKGKLNYQNVYNDIAKILEEDPDYDYGSYGPVFMRLAWHAAGTYDKNVQNGGSNGGTMRFEPEASHAANAGLQVARTKLEKIKKKYPAISYGDLWTLAGVVALQEMGGPIVPWKPGRVDGEAKDCPPDGRLPDGGNPTPQHPRDVFYRMGFNDQEIVALLGAHTLGKCHTDRSGFDGPWTASPTTFSNSYFQELLNKTWVEKKWTGPKQFVDKETGELMMLPADMAFVKDKEFKKWVELYAKDETKFFNDFGAAFKKLIELGVQFTPDSKDIIFKSA